MQHLTTVLADAENFPYERGSYDGAFVRWLLCFLPEPRRVLERLADALRPGASLVVLDYFNYLAVSIQPPDAECREIFETYDECVRKLGGNFDIGGSIPVWLTEMGFVIEDLVPIQKIGVPGSMIWDWVSSFHASHWPELRQRGFIDDETVNRFGKAWERVSNQAGTFFYTPPMLGVVARKT